MKHFEFNWDQCKQCVYAQAWEVDEAIGVVCIVHGIGEHSGRYDEVAAYLNSRKLNVLAFDHFGHGKTSGQRGAIPSLEEVYNSVDHLLNEARTRYGELPLFLYGHSMGGNVVSNYILRRKPSITGSILTSPWFEMAFEPPKFKLWLGKLMLAIYKRFSDKSDLDTSLLTRNHDAVLRYEADELVHNKVTPGLFFPMYRAGKWALQHASQLNTPTLLLHGEDDGITSNSASRRFAHAAPSHIISFKEWPKGYHELHNEPDRAAVMDTIGNWITHRITYSPA